MKKWLMAVLFITALVLAACGGASEDDATDETADDNATEEQAGTDDAATEEDAGDDAAGDAVDVAAGEEVYKNSCAMCHGADLSGGAGPALNAVGSKYSAEEIADIVENGIGTMPAQPVEGEDLTNLSNWLAEQQ